MDDTDTPTVRVKDELLLPPVIKPFVATPSPRPPLAPSDRHYSGRKRSRSSEEESATNERGGGSSSTNGGGGGNNTRGGGGGSTGENHTPSRPSGGVNAAVTPPLAMTPLPSPLSLREPVVYKDTMLSDSEWEREIAEFGRQLDDMLARVTDRQLVAQTAQYMRAYPQHSLRLQIKIKQRALTESPRQAQVKLMLVYLFHEFLKLFNGDELRQIQRDWYLTIDEVLHACMRDMRNNPDMKKRVFKTVARWEELGIYSQKIKQWKALSAGDAKPRRTLVRLPRTEAERLAEAPDQLQQFPPPPVNQTLLQVNRTNYPFVFERSNFRTAFELKQHWRFSGVAFIEVLARCLGISRDISLTASMFFHRVFDRGIYAKERFKFAAACIFLAAKASSKRMKLIRMVKTMHEILELPLLAGDEEILDMERMQLLYYEIEVLKGVEFDLTTDMPFYYLKGTLDQMPEKFRQDVEEGAHSTLVELFWLPLCLSVRPRFLAEAAAYIACRNKDRVFSFSWCREDKDGNVLTEKAAKEILKDYRQLVDWKKDQQRHFDTLVRTSSSAGGTGPWDLQEVFQCQRGGLRIDVTTIEHEMEYTQKGVNESRAVLSMYVEEEGDTRRRNADSNNSSSYSRRRGEDSVRIKTEARSSTRYDDRGSTRDSYRRENDRSNGSHERDRDRGRDNDRESDRYGDRERERDTDRNRDRERERGNDRDRGSERDQDRSSARSKDTARESDRTRVKEEPGVSSSSRNDRGQKDKDQDKEKDKNRSSEYSRTRERERSPRKYESESRSRDYDRDVKRESYRDRDRGDETSKKRDARSKEYESSRDRERSTRERDDRGSKYSNRRSRSRSRSPRESSRGSSKRKDRSASRSKSRSRERSSHTSRTEDRGERERERERDRGRDRDRERGRDHKERSYSSSRDRSRRDDRSDKRYDDQRDSTKIKEETTRRS